MIGKTVSHYRVLEPIGAGGMGVVYKAEDIRLSRRVALKFLSADRAGDREAMDRFMREARAASALNHPNICTIYEVDEFEGSPFIAMELLEGDTLERKVDGTPLAVGPLVDLAIQIADAPARSSTTRSTIRRSPICRESWRGIHRARARLMRTC